MLIQENGVRLVVGRNLYIVSIIILTGLKVGLIFHLILRGVWTGFVGLSYVFPEGVNKQNIAEKKEVLISKNLLDEFVIKLEKICSLLFSFVFSSIIFIGSFCLRYDSIRYFVHDRSRYIINKNINTLCYYSILSSYRNNMDNSCN